MFSCKETRKYVKENIRGKAGTIFGYAVLFFIFRGLINGFLSQFDGLFGFLFPVLAAAATTPIQVGLFRIVTNILNGKKPSFGMLFEDYKYFVNLFVIGLVCNLVIQAGYRIYIVGVLLDYIYIGILYFFIYNSNLSLGDFFNKAFEKVKDYFSECVILELSYAWPMILTVIVYVILFVTMAIAAAATNIDKFTNLENVESLIPILTSFIPLVILTIVFFIVLIVLVVIIAPRQLLAEAKFYSVFATTISEPKKQNQPSQTTGSFCPNCGSKVDGQFCSNCGNKIN